MKLSNKCGQCGHSYALGKATTTLHYFRKYPGMSYLEGMCPREQCGAGELMFYALNDNFPSKELSHELVRKAEWMEVIELDEPLEWERKAYDIVNESERVKVYSDEDLTDSVRDRHRRIVDVFHFDLEDATPEDIINAPKGRFPVRWD